MRERLRIDKSLVFGIGNGLDESDDRLGFRHANASPEVIYNHMIDNGEK